MTGFRSWRIAQFRGVDINLHISLLLILPYIIFVTAARFRLVAQAAGVKVSDLGVGPWVSGVLVSIALFISILLHEFGHVLTAQAAGVKARSITLMMLGGISSLERMPDKMPEKKFGEFKLSIAGPVISFALAAILYVLEKTSTSPDVIFFSYWLARINLTLGIFNLLPAFPLDGGRALRSLLSARQGPVRATRAAVKVSLIFAWILGILGLLSFNILLILIAFFIYAGAQTELSLMLSRALLRGLHARDVCVHTPLIEESANLTDTSRLMLESRSTALPVLTRSGDPAVVSLEDIRRIPHNYRETTTVRDVMQTVPRALNANEQVSEVIGDLAVAPAQVLPVVEGGPSGSILGVVRYSDLTEILQLKSLEQSEKAA